MLLFAHAGLGLGAALVAASINLKDDPYTEVRLAPPEPLLRRVHHVNARLLGALHSLQRFIDIRLLLLATMLPDVIDKPLSLILGNGRTYSHTSLFLLALAVLGAVLFWVRRQTWGFGLALGVFSHLLLDFMWRDPRTLLWPLAGASLPREQIETWAMVAGWLKALTSSWVVGLPDLLGLALLFWVGYLLFLRCQLVSLLVRGRI